MKHSLGIYLASISFVFLSTSLWAETPAKKMQCVHAKGEVLIDDKPESYARQLAIREALKNASMSNNLKISASQEMEGYRLTKSHERFTTLSKVKNYKILYEGKKPFGFGDEFDQYGNEIKGAKEKADNTYLVEIEACLTEDAAACSQLPGFQYQTRLAIAPVTIDPKQVYAGNDIANLLEGYQAELDQRLSSLGYENKVIWTQGGALAQGRTLRPNLSAEILDPLRDQTGAQFILLTVVKSLSKQIEDINNSNGFKRFYNLEVRPDARYIEIEWFLVDLMNHKIVAEKRQGFDVKGDVVVGRDRPFGSNAFFATDTGMVFHALLKQQTDAVFAELQCKGLETQIIDIRGKDYVVYLSAASGVQVGDTLSVYHKFGANIQFQGVDLGSDSEPVGFLKIKRIQNRFAVGELIGKNGRIEFGDLVKSW